MHRTFAGAHARAWRRVAIFDQQLRSRFDWLREPDPDAVALAALFIVFDHRRDDASGGDQLLLLLPL